MIRCLQFFLKNGLVESKKVNLDLRKLRNSVGAEFIEFMELQNLNDFRIGRKEFRDMFNDKYKNIARFNTPQKFNKKVKDYCEFYGVEVEELKYNGIVSFYFKNENTEKQEDELEF